MIELYKDFNNCDTKLVLIFPIFDEELEKYIHENFRYNAVREKILRKFSPAIREKMLDIKDIKVTKKELDKYIESRKDLKDILL